MHVLWKSMNYNLRSTMYNCLMLAFKTYHHHQIWYRKRFLFGSATKFSFLMYAFPNSKFKINLMFLLLETTLPITLLNIQIQTGWRHEFSVQFFFFIRSLDFGPGTIFIHISQVYQLHNQITNFQGETHVFILLLECGFI